MKRFILTILILSSGLASIRAQSTTTSFDVDGIKVIFKPTIKKVINVRVYFRGGVTNYPILKAGIENMALEAATQCGTQKYGANAFRDTLDKYDISIYGKSLYDYGFIQLNTIKRYFNTGWDLFADAVNNPVFNIDEFAMLKSKLIANAKNYYSNPYNNINELQMRSAFANTSYAISPMGTEETISDINATDVKEYYNTLLNKNKMFIVVVGNITKDELYEKILTAFDNIKSAPYLPANLNVPLWVDNKLSKQSQDLKINYISAIMNAPDFTNPDYVPFRLAVSGLSGNLGVYIHNQGASFDPGAYTASLRMPFCAMHASTNNPQQVMMGMMAVLKEIQLKGYDDEWLQHIKNIYITTNYINEQSAADITNNLGLAEVLGNWQYADDLPQLVNMVTLEQVNRVINYYIKGVRWSYLGNLNNIEGFTLPIY